VAIALFAACFALPSTASAVTAPVLANPAANADPVTEGGTVEFTWSGTLQGDPTALDRSFFRVEVIATANMPAGAQSAWPDNKLEAFVPTDPGSDVTTASMGVPAAGEYRWRVCAWGVDDVATDNVIKQLPGGCSTSRAITTVAASSSAQVPGELKLENRTQVAGATRTVVVTRPADDAPVEPVVDDPGPAAPPSTEEVPPATFQDVRRTTIESGSGSAVAGLGDEVDPTASRSRAVGGAVIGALGSNIPLVPIPFWTLAMLLACVPILRAWRRSVLGMFEWSDGSIDGLGTMPDVHGALAPVAVASGVKDRSMTADADAPATAVTAPHAPDGGRHAA
jgi:hypothetical protein